MSAFANITLNNGAATPVAHTFSADDIDNGVSKFVDRSGGIAIGYPAVTFSLRSPTKTNRNFKLTVKVVTPVLEVTSPSTSTGIQPAPTVAYVPLATIEFVLPDRSSVAERKDLLAYVKNILANTYVTEGVQDLAKIY